MKWFWALYFVDFEAGALSAERLRKLIGVSWITAERMLIKLRARGGQDSRHLLIDLSGAGGALFDEAAPGREAPAHESMHGAGARGTID